MVGHHTQSCALANAHTASHHNAIHQGDVGLGVVLNQMVEAVLFGEEVFQPHITAECRLVEIANVATCTKRTERAFFVAAAHHHGPHLRIVLPLQQHMAQLTHHTQRQSIQGLRAVKRDQA